MSQSPVRAAAAEAALLLVSRAADLVMYLTLLGSVAEALAIGWAYHSLGFAMACGLALLLLASAAFFTARGSMSACLMLTCCNVGAVIVQIQLGYGMVEFHFGIFVLLGLLLVYRDWRPLVLAAALFAVHHVLFDRLQAQGFAVYCTSRANFLKIMLHAGYVVVQTGVEIVLALRLRQAAVEAAELSAIVRLVDQGQRLCLDMSTMAVSTPISTMLHGAIQKMEAAMTEVSTAASSIGITAAEIAASNHDLSGRTAQQAARLQQTAAAMEQLSVTVRNTSHVAEQANGLAGHAARAAADGSDAVARVTDTMAQIAESTRRIADLTSAIDGIAFQTNILALNAAVEAARAGEQGRGFAVVAGEVRTLAQHSATASKEIKALTGDSVERVDTGVGLVHAAGTGMNDIVDQARKVSELIEEISAASIQQAAGLDEVGEAMGQLDAVTQQNTAQVEESAAATESLNQQAIQLRTVVARFVLGQGLLPASP